MSDAVHDLDREFSESDSISVSSAWSRPQVLADKAHVRILEVFYTRAHAHT
jgi:hypothetical protein